MVDWKPIFRSRIHAEGFDKRFGPKADAKLEEATQKLIDLAEAMDIGPLVALGFQKHDCWITLKAETHIEAPGRKGRAGGLSEEHGVTLAALQNVVDAPENDLPISSTLGHVFLHEFFHQCDQIYKPGQEGHGSYSSHWHFSIAHNRDMFHVALLHAGLSNLRNGRIDPDWLQKSYSEMAAQYNHFVKAAQQGEINIINDGDVFSDKELLPPTADQYFSRFTRAQVPGMSPSEAYLYSLVGNPERARQRAINGSAQLLLLHELTYIFNNVIRLTHPLYENDKHWMPRRVEQFASVGGLNTYNGLVTPELVPAFLPSTTHFIQSTLYPDLQREQQELMRQYQIMNPPRPDVPLMVEDPAIHSMHIMTEAADARERTRSNGSWRRLFEQPPNAYVSWPDR